MHTRDITPQHRNATVVQNQQVGPEIYRIRIDCPEIASSILPGQFVMLRDARPVVPILGRPLALWDLYFDESGLPKGIDLVYMVFGSGTASISSLSPGEAVALWGPLGNPFPVDFSDSEKHLLDQSNAHLICIAGGIGQTPFPAYIREMTGLHQYGTLPRQLIPVRHASLFYGARTQSLLYGLEDFKRSGVEIQIATEDGSCGTRGRITELVQQILPGLTGPIVIIACGPLPMLAAVHAIGLEFGCPTYVSLECKMACGFGVCFSCVCPVKCTAEPGWDYQRTCIHGPTYRSELIDWERAVTK